MTAMMRQISEQILTICLLVALFPLLSASPAVASSVVTTTVTDPLSGVAIDGYDPVSYFTETEPLVGSPAFVHEWAGVPWYFASAANRDAFMRAPDVYAPRYGGHCVTSLGRGYLSDGKPRLYLLEKMQLYFFYSTANREAFLLSPEAALTQAAENWPRLAEGLIGPRPDLVEVDMAPADN
jgi:YHS domain-containing protein